MATCRARVEEYPEISAQENMQQFQDRISDIESQISDRREFYNEAVTRYNTRIDQFPYLIFARQFGFDERELFEVTEEEKEDVDVGAAFDS
jgi:LemA protein